MSDVQDKGSGKADWETHSLRYVVSAITSAQRRQQKLWNQLAATRTAAGVIPVDWPRIEEYVEAVRRTYSLMIDLETVGAEFERKFGKGGSKRTKAAPAKGARATKKKRR